MAQPTSYTMNGITVSYQEAVDAANILHSIPQTQAGLNEYQWIFSPANPNSARFYVAYYFGSVILKLDQYTRWPTTDAAGNQILNCGYIPPNLVVEGSSYYTKPPGTRTSKIT